jgi:hypothetical protein
LPLVAEGTTMLCPIIQTSDNRLFHVREAEFPELAHLWVGVEVTRTKGGAYVHKSGARERYVRKAATRLVRAA